MNQQLKPQKTKKDSTLSTKQIVWIVGAFLFVIIVCSCNYLLLKNIKLEERGITGDMFGVANALFSGLAFAGIIFTILLQRNELELQRKELEETRNEFIQQNKTLSHQRFENTFFAMLNLQNEIIQSMQSGLTKGREVINVVTDRHLYPHLANIAQHSLQHSNISEIALTEENKYYLRKIFSDFYHNYYTQVETNFNHYFRHLYHIYKFIYFSDLSKEEKNFYSSLARAQLSQNELLMIAFNGIVENYGHPKFLYLMKEYDLLKNFRWNSIKSVGQQQMIKYFLEKVEYPFQRARPTERNID